MKPYPIATEFICTHPSNTGMRMIADAIYNACDSIQTMKQLLKRLIALLVRLYSSIYTYRFCGWLNSKRNTLYSMWVSHFLGEVGEKSYFARPLLLQGHGERRIRIGSRTSIGHHTVLGCWERYGQDECYEPEIIIGNYCSIGEYCHITAINKISVGDGLLTGRFVYIGDNAHGGLSWDEADTPPARRHLTSKGEIRIGRNVWIGDKVSVFGGVTIGDNVIIGAGSIVTHDIPSNCMAAGMPAKVIKRL